MTRTLRHSNDAMVLGVLILVLACSGSEPVAATPPSGSASLERPAESERSADSERPAEAASPVAAGRPTAEDRPVDTETVTAGGAVVETSTAFEEQVLGLVNQQRAVGAQCGDRKYGPAAPLIMDTTLRHTAREHSQEMAVRDYFSHTGPDGRTFDRRMREAGYHGALPWFENIASGSPSPREVVANWMASPAHCANIMNGRLRAAGVGYARRAGSTYTHYWTQNFGGR